MTVCSEAQSVAGPTKMMTHRANQAYFSLGIFQDIALRLKDKCEATFSMLIRSG
jgi:hypothetical protein